MSIKTCIKPNGKVCDFFKPKDAPKLLPKVVCKYATKLGCGYISGYNFDSSEIRREELNKKYYKDQK